ncbi:MAG: hypothetical protein V4513_07070 [Pseudomonadota bacterium]
MATSAQGRTPAHLWIVGILSLLWNGFGCYDYFMTRTKGAAYIDSMMDTGQGSAIMAYVNSFPIWVAAAWGLGVWGGLAGSILLLMRSRHAVTAFAVSMVGAIVGLGWQLMNPSNIAEMSEIVNKVMPYVIIAIAVVLFLYARAQAKKGLLR